MVLAQTIVCHYLAEFLLPLILRRECCFYFYFGIGVY